MIVCAELYCCRKQIIRRARTGNESQEKRTWRFPFQTLDGSDRRRLKEPEGLLYRVIIKWFWMAYFVWWGISIVSLISSLSGHSPFSFPRTRQEKMFNCLPLPRHWLYSSLLFLYKYFSVTLCLLQSPCLVFHRPSRWTAFHWNTGPCVV